MPRPTCSLSVMQNSPCINTVIMALRRYVCRSDFSQESRNHYATSMMQCTSLLKQAMRADDRKPEDSKAAQRVAASLGGHLSTLGSCGSFVFYMALGYMYTLCVLFCLRLGLAGLRGLASHSRFSCFSLPVAGITGIHHHGLHPLVNLYLLSVNLSVISCFSRFDHWESELPYSSWEIKPQVRANKMADKETLKGSRYWNCYENTGKRQYPSDNQRAHA